MTSPDWLAWSTAHGWQPIETAPKGGGAERTDDPAYVEPPRILGWSRSGGLRVVYWDWYYAEGGNGYEPGRTAWVSEGVALWPGDAPTHWMLPAPPQEQEQGVARFHRELIHEVKGYTVVFEKGKTGLAAHSRGVAGRAFFTRHANAVAFKRELEQIGLKCFRPRVAKAVACVTAWPKDRLR